MSAPEANPCPDVSAADGSADASSCFSSAISLSFRAFCTRNKTIVTKMRCLVNLFNLVASTQKRRCRTLCSALARAKNNVAQIHCRKVVAFCSATCYNMPCPWGYSSVGRALEWHSRGQGFDSPYLHHLPKRSDRSGLFFLFVSGRWWR